MLFLIFFDKSLSFCVTRHLHDGQESCRVGLKNDLFRKILLSKQFMY